MKKLLTLLMLISVIAMSGCDTTRHINKMRQKYCTGNTTSKIDSNTVKTITITEMDSTYYYSAKSLWRALLACDSEGHVQVISYVPISNPDGIKSTVKMDGNTAYFENDIDSAKIVLKWKETHIETTTKVNKEKETQTPIYIPYQMSGLQKFFYITGMIQFFGIILFLIIWFVWKFYTNKIKGLLGLIK